MNDNPEPERAMTKQKKTAGKELTRFEQMMRSLPANVVGGLNGDEKTEFDLEQFVQIEIDLTEEGQDGTSRRNLKPLYNWLKKWGIERT